MPIHKIMEEALLKVGKAPAFRKVWEDVVLEGNAFEQMFSGKEVVEEEKMYTDWRQETISIYKFDRRIRFRIPIIQSPSSGLTLCL